MSRMEKFMVNIAWPAIAVLFLVIWLCAKAPAAELPKLEYVYDVAELADMMTTADIKNHPNLIEENPILGKHPSDAKIAGYGLLSAGLHAAITYGMVSSGVPKGLVNGWEYVSIGVEAGFTAHNYSIGLRCKF